MRLVDRLLHPSDPPAATTVRGAIRSPRLLDRSARVLHTACVSLTPAIAAVVALAALAVFPWSASRRLASIRLDRAETVLPARQYVRDIVAAMAVEMAAGGAGGGGNPAAMRGSPVLARRYGQAVALERARESALGALAPRLGDTLAGDIAHLRLLSAQWHAKRRDAADAGLSLADFLATAALLDSALAVRQALQLDHIQSIESLDVLLPSVLVPLLAIVLLAIHWAGRRMATLAHEAERSRLALALASDQKVTLLRGLTHDLKNSLGAAGGYAMLLREEYAGPLAPVQRDQVVRIGHIIEQTIIAVEDALLVARTEAGALPVRRHRADLRTLVLEAASDYVAAAEGAGLALVVEIAEDLPLVETDPSLVSKIIGNLLSNAIKYTPAGGRVGVRTSFRPIKGRHGSATGPWVVVEVCDSGPGIPAALRERVFDEFFRAPTATTTARGEGIGLAMSRRVARLLDGEITLASEEGRGATFTLWIPAPSRDAARPDASPPAAGGGDHPRETVAGEISTANGSGEITLESRRAGAQPPSANYDRRRAVQ